MIARLAAASALSWILTTAAPSQAQFGAQLQAIPDVNGFDNETFGHSVILSGDLALVGARGGSAYLFNAMSGDLIRRFEPNALDDAMFFGTSVAVDGGRALIGSPSSGSLQTGAYLFDLTTGQLLVRLQDRPVRPLSRGLGESVALEGDTALVGASPGFASSLSSAVVFDATTGELKHRLYPSVEAGSTQFGSAVALAGGKALVGSFDEDLDGFNAGAAYVFDAATGEQLRRLVPDDINERDLFGYSVAASGNLAIVGSIRNGESGAAYLFDLSTGRQLQKLQPSDPAGPATRFGRSVAIHGDRAMVGATGDWGSGGRRTGAAYLFDVTTGAQLAKFISTDVRPGGGEFGRAVALTANRAIVSDTRGNGVAYVFSLVPEPSGALLASLAMTAGAFGRAANRRRACRIRLRHF